MISEIMDVVLVTVIAVVVVLVLAAIALLSVLITSQRRKKIKKRYVFASEFCTKWNFQGGVNKYKVTRRELLRELVRNHQ